MAGSWSISIGGTTRKWKTLEVNRKVRQDSPAEFKATIEYGSDITFNQVVTILRDDGSGAKTEWKGFIEDIEISWDENSRLLNIGGRDMTFLLWRKYVENFNNPIPKTGGFFGSVSANELLKFLLRTPRSDLPVNSDYGPNDVPIIQQFQYNKEGWGLDVSRFTSLDAQRTSYGNINSTILRKRNLYWANSGSQVNTDLKLEFDPATYTPCYDSDVGLQVHTTTDIGPLVEFDNVSCVWIVQVSNPALVILSGTAITITGGIGHGTTNTPSQVYYIGGLLNFTTKIVDGVIDCTWDVSHGGSSPYINVPYTGQGSPQYIISHTGVNDTVDFSTQDFLPSEHPTSIGSVILTLWWQPQGSWNMYASSQCDIYLWVESAQNWVPLGVVGGKGSVFGEPWHVSEFDASRILMTVSDVNNTKIRFVETSSSNGTLITYVSLTIGYSTGGIVHDESDPDYPADWVSVQFSKDTVMGMYFECREHPDNYLRNYKIVTAGGNEDFGGYTEQDPNSHISVGTTSYTNDTITFGSYQNEVAYLVEPFSVGDIEETFSFEVDDAQAHPFAFIPFCVTNATPNSSHGYDYLLATGGVYLIAIEVSYLNGKMTITARLKNASGTQTVTSATLSLDSTYWVKVVRTGSVLELYIYNNSSMNTLDLIKEADNTTPFHVTWTDNTPYNYRYQAITYNGSVWSPQYVNGMDTAPIGIIDDAGFETGDFDGWWIASSGVSVTTAEAHSGTHSCRVPINSGSISEQIGTALGFGISGVNTNNITSASFWHKGTLGMTFTFELDYGDLTYQDFTITCTGDWAEYNFLPLLKPNALLWDFIVFGVSANYLYVDDFMILQTSTWTWDSFGGDAVASTDTTHEETWGYWVNGSLVSNTGCVKIVAASASEKAYYEKNTLVPTDQVKIDAWVRIPAPTSVSVNHDLESLTYTSYGSNYHWGVVGSTPYVNNEGDMDDNHVWASGNLPATPEEIDDYFVFQLINTVTGEPLGSFSPNSSSKLHIEARIYNTGGGNATAATVRLYIWVQHENSGAGQWHNVTDIGFSASGNAWGTIYDSDVSAILLNKTDWDNAKVRFDIESVSGTDLAESEIQIGYIRFHAQGTGYKGSVELIKVFNKTIAGSPDPSSGYIACVSAQLNPDEVADIGTFRWQIDGFTGSGTWWTILASSIDLDQEVPIDTWTYIRLYATVGTGTSGAVTLMIQGINSSPSEADGTTVISHTGMNNSAYGPIDSLDFEMSFGYNTGTGYLNGIVVNTEGGTHSDGKVYAGTGPDIVLDDTYANPQTSLLTANATAGASTVTVANASLFVGAYPAVEISDSVHSEVNWVISINTGTNVLTLYNPLANNYTTIHSAQVYGPINIYPDIISSWDVNKLPNNGVINNLKIICTENSTEHGWEVTQIYIYKTDPVKYRVMLESGSAPTELKLTFDPSGYVDCPDQNVSGDVWATTPPSSVSKHVGTLNSFSNDLYEWRIDQSTGIYSPVSGDKIYVVVGSGLTQYGILSTNAVSCFAGGPYIQALNINETTTNYSPIGPLNIMKNRLSDALWDLCVTITDDFEPYEWWINYDNNNTFCISDRRGNDKSSNVIFQTNVNMGGCNYQKSSRDTFQRVQVIGSGEGNTNVNSSSFWETDEDAMDEINSFIETIYTQKQVANPRIANRYAKVKLKLDASPKRKNAITALITKDDFKTFDYTDPTDSGANDTYDVGDDVYLNDFLTGIDDSFRVWNIKKMIDEKGENVTLTCQAPYLDIGNVWTDIWKELKALGIVGTIAQDWAGEGTDVAKVNADKMSTLFSVTAKNKDADLVDMGGFSTQSGQYLPTSPVWWYYGMPNGLAPPPANNHNAKWDCGNNTLIICGGDSGGLGEMEVEARYAEAISTSDGGITIRQNAGQVQATDTLVTWDIPYSQAPKFTGEFAIWQPINNDGTNYKFWAVGDFVEFGMYNRDSGIGVKFRVVCVASGVFTLYALYFTQAGDNALDLATLLLLKKAQPICNVQPSNQNLVHKYKVEIITTYTGPVNNIIFNVYDELADNPSTTQISAAFLGVDGNQTVRPMYVHAIGTGATNNMCIMHFYDLKCEQERVGIKA